MTEEQIETVSTEENEPIYYKPKALSLIATVAAWVSWAVIAVFIVAIAAKFGYVMAAATQNNTTLMAMLTDPQNGEQARIFVLDNIIMPFFTGLTFFLLLQGIHVGLNALLEIDFNVRELTK